MKLFAKRLPPFRIFLLSLLMLLVSCNKKEYLLTHIYFIDEDSKEASTMHFTYTKEGDISQISHGQCLLHFSYDHDARTRIISVVEGVAQGRKCTFNHGKDGTLLKQEYVFDGKNPTIETKEFVYISGFLTKITNESKSIRGKVLRNSTLTYDSLNRLSSEKVQILIGRKPKYPQNTSYEYTKSAVDKYFKFGETVLYHSRYTINNSKLYKKERIPVYHDDQDNLFEIAYHPHGQPQRVNYYYKRKLKSTEEYHYERRQVTGNRFKIKPMKGIPPKWLPIKHNFFALEGYFTKDLMYNLSSPPFSPTRRQR